MCSVEPETGPAMEHRKLIGLSWIYRLQYWPPHLFLPAEGALSPWFPLPDPSLLLYSGGVYFKSFKRAGLSPIPEP